jgi:hypothetical protein
MKKNAGTLDEYLDSEDESMFYWDPSGLRPPEELMHQATRVMLSDPYDKHKVSGRVIKNWARKNCKTFFWYDVTDVSDASYTTDEIHCYYFIDERDVMMFTLRWGGTT